MLRNPPSHMVQHPPKRTPTPRELWRSFHRLVAPPSGPSPPLMYLSEGLAQRTVFARLHTGLPGEANLQGFSYNTDPTGEPERDRRCCRCSWSHPGQSAASGKLPRKETALLERGHRHPPHKHHPLELLKSQSKIKNKWAAQSTFSILQTP